MSDWLLNPHKREWIWIAGEAGKPGMTGDLVTAAESTHMITDPFMELLGTNAASAGVTHNPEGGIDIVTAGTDNDQMIVVPHEATNTCLMHPDTLTWGSDREMEFEVLFKTPAIITTLLMMMGWKQDDSPVDLAITDTDLVVVQFNTDDTDTTWGVHTAVNNATDVDFDSGITVAASTIYKVGIKFDFNEVAHVSINDQEVAALTWAGQTADFIPMFAVQSLDDTPSATSPITLYGWRLSRKYGSAN